jgi:predicted  nucleic acid-binding Zn-ribbon protein
MPVEVIDTLEIAHDLRSAGLTEPQAEAIARQFKRRYEADRQELVTRDYLDHALDKLRTELRDEIADVRGEVTSLRAHMDQELASVRGEFRSEIASVRADIAGVRAEIERLVRDLLFKLAGLIVAAVAIVGALGVLF